MSDNVHVLCLIHPSILQLRTVSCLGRDPSQLVIMAPSYTRFSVEILTILPILTGRVILNRDSPISKFDVNTRMLNTISNVKT